MFFCCGPKITPPSLPVIIRYYALLTATLLAHQSSSGLISRLIGSRLDTIISDCILQMRYQLLLFIFIGVSCCNIVIWTDAAMDASNNYDASHENKF